ncbi:MAG: PIG-L family deacetylase, partial [Corynebacterium sp.]|nr:PIG-L family deacetylase [Corynebacterium sp.]
TCAVEIAHEHVRAGIDSLSSHEVYLASLPDHAKPEDIIGDAARAGGEALGTEYAIAFRSFAL